jgi:hypothetical protein
VEEEDEFIEEDYSVDWIFPPIYDIYPSEEDLLDEVYLFLDTINIVEENDVHDVFDESLKSEISQWGLGKINCVDFLGIENFLSSFPKQNLDVGFGILEEILNFRGQERIHRFWKIFTNGEFMTVNQELLKIISPQVGASNFKYNTKSHVMKACKVFIFQYQVSLMLRSMEWKGLIWTSKRSRKI